MVVAVTIVTLILFTPIVTGYALVLLALIVEPRR
jgi:hypothetical protein